MDAAQIVGLLCLILVLAASLATGTGGDGGSGGSGGDGGSGDKGGSGDGGNGGGDKGGGTNDGAQDVSKLPDWAQKLLGDLRKEAGNYRTSAKKAEDDLKKLTDANKTDAEKQADRLKELEKAQEAHQSERRELLTRMEIERLARKLNIVDEEAAYRLMDLAGVEYDQQSGKPTNVEKLLQELAKARPYLVAQQGTDKGSGGSGTGAQGGSAANGGTGRGATLTIDQIKGMTRDQINANWDAVQKALAGGK